MAPKKKLSKKEKARIEAEQAEVLRVEQEKERQRKLEEERERKRKEREEAEKRQQQEIMENRVRRQQLKESVSYFGDIKVVIDGINGEKKMRAEWERYMRCDGLPDARVPGELRKYIHVWKKDIDIRLADERNWLLKTNERTLLTQDKDVPDLSRECLRNLQENYGDIYSQRIREVLGILEDLDDWLESKTLSSKTLSDLCLLKSEIRAFLHKCIDDFSYKIMSHVDRDMVCTKPGVSNYTYDSDILKTEIWAILGDALTPKDQKFRDENRNTDIDFPLLKLELSLPPIIKVMNMAIRGLWLNYDHFSDYCKNFKMPKKKYPHLNILQQTKKEWKKRKEILRSALEDTTKESSLEDFENEKVKSRPVDVDKAYTEYEDEMNKARRRAIGPEALNLDEFDVNLRKYRIISGVYAIDLLEYPQQDRRLNADSFIRTIVSPNRLTRKFFYHPYRPPPPPPPGIRRLPEEIEAEMKLIESNLEKLSQITLVLPDTVLWFEPPIVCRWESLEETTAVADSNVQDKVEMHKEEDKKESTIKLDQLPLKEVVDFDLCNIPHHLDLFALFKDFVIPRLPNGYCIRIEYTKPEKKKPIVHYLSRNFNISGEVPKKKKSCPHATPIVENLIETGSPRPFDFTINFTKILTIKHAPSVRRRSSCFDAIEVKDYSFGQKQSYMFSELIEDLDQIHAMQTNFPESTLEEINSSICLQSETAEEAPRRFSGIIIMRETDIPEKDENAEENAEEESGSEFDDLEEPNDQNSFELGEEFQKDVGKWSTRDVHDVKFNEDKFSIQFRTGRLGYFGFASNRYSNMPYQTWELKPDLKNPSIILYSLTAAVISMEISVTKEGFCVTNFQGGSTTTINDLIGKIVSMEDLKSRLQSSAVDIFPDEDSFCYTEGSCEKNYVMEMHLYSCMSTLALSHNFSWSRWNLLSGSRIAVLLMREFIEGKKIPDHSTLLVTPLKTSIIDCTEVSTSFSTAGIPGMEFYADLHQLALAHAHPSNKEKRRTMDPVLRENVAVMLMSTRPLSFC